MPKVKTESGKTINLPRYARLLRWWKSDPYAEAAVGRATNEFKSDIIKSGGDLFCPKCDKHFSLATFSHRIQCPSCKFRWSISLKGWPVTHAQYIEEATKDGKQTEKDKERDKEAY